MFYTGHSKLKLLARNEGKLKAYESCFDVRAWSHDTEVRDSYIRDWIKKDMPVSVIPIKAVSSCLRTMTRRSRGRSTPRCHPNCKSKVILESICNSCHAIKECLKDEECFEKYFEEEEFETSHWPCEKCLDALKSLRMFWKIIIERLFRISFPKNGDLESSCCSNESAQSVAKAWEEEIRQQTLIVKKLTPIASEQLNDKPTYSWKSYMKYIKNIMSLNNSQFIVVDEEDDDNICTCEDKATETDPTICSIKENKTRSKLINKKISKSTLFRVTTVDFAGDTCNIDCQENNIYIKNNFEYLQHQFDMQSDELNQLKTENTSLKLQLQNMTKKYSPLHSRVEILSDSASAIPEPYESYCEKEDNVKNIDSEMVITLKNYENENFKRVSMLQVLHKSNSSRILNNIGNNSYCKKTEDPIKILTKVHNTFGAIVRRELTIANQKKCDRKPTEIDASYQKLHPSRSTNSCSTISSQSLINTFVSTTEVKHQ